MSPEEKGRDSDSSGISRPYKDFSGMDEESVRETKRQLANLFSAEGESGGEVENVIETSIEDYVLVKHGGVFHMVFFEGGSPQLLSWEEVRGMPQLQQWCEDFFD